MVKIIKNRQTCWLICETSNEEHKSLIYLYVDILFNMFFFSKKLFCQANAQYIFFHNFMNQFLSNYIL